MRFAVPILTYHAANIAGSEYAGNDHVAFASDLALVGALGWRIASIPAIVDALLGRVALPSEKVLGLSLDDGTDFDFLDLDHPLHGRQRGMHGVLDDYAREHGEAQPQLHATSFVVVSPEALPELDASCLVGRGWWTDGWWKRAIAGGRWAIANHSWDHNHLGIARTAVGGERGTFRNVAAFDVAEAEIAAAAERLRSFAPNPGARLFAYPYGEANDYLVEDYLPRHGARIGVDAAFAADPAPITAASNRWLLPRFVCGHHWKSPGELTALLREIAP